MMAEGYHDRLSENDIQNITVAPKSNTHGVTMKNRNKTG